MVLGINNTEINIAYENVCMYVICTYKCMYKLVTFILPSGAVADIHEVLATH